MREDNLASGGDSHLEREALRGVAERYRKVLESAPEGIAIHCEGRFVYFNSSGLDVLATIAGQTS